LGWKHAVQPASNSPVDLGKSQYGDDTPRTWPDSAFLFNIKIGPTLNGFWTWRWHRSSPVL